MADFIVKKSKHRVDPKHPESTDPSYAAAVEKAKKAPPMKFEDRGQKEWYDQAVRSNPGNIPGLPAFFPPLPPERSNGFGPGKPAETLPCGHKWVSMWTQNIRDKDGNITSVRLFYKCKHGHPYEKTKGGPFVELNN